MPLLDNELSTKTLNKPLIFLIANVKMILNHQTIGFIKTCLFLCLHTSQRQTPDSAVQVERPTHLTVSSRRLVVL